MTGRNRTALARGPAGLFVATLALLALSGCSSSNFRNSAEVTVAYDAPRDDVIAAYLKAFKELDRVSFELRGDTLMAGKSTDPDFPADVEVRFVSEGDLTVVQSGFQYDIVDRFDHYPMRLERSAAKWLPEGSGNLRPEAVYPSDSTRCDVPPLPDAADVVPVEIIGGLKALESQIFYPPTAKKSGVEGAVFAGFVVDERNRVVCVEIISGLPAGMNAQVISGILATNFRAGTVNGKPVPMRSEIPWSFRSDER